MDENNCPYYKNDSPDVKLRSILFLKQMNIRGIKLMSQRCMEGLVARPAVEILDRMGRRVIVKIKVKDF